jgi:hypothetical protein
MAREPAATPLKSLSRGTEQATIAVALLESLSYDTDHAIETHFLITLTSINKRPFVGPRRWGAA